MTTDTPTQADLKPCPFCGGEAALYEGHRDHWKVRCTSCDGMRGRWFARDGAQTEAIAAWNTRASQPEAGEPVAWMYEAHGDVISVTRTRYDPGQIKALRYTETPLYAHPIAAGDGEKLREAAEEVVMRAFDQYRARNGKMCSIEGDDGEKCWIVPFDAMEDLRQALSATPPQPPADLVEREERKPPEFIVTDEAVRAASVETERLCHELDITNADHIVLWLETNLAPGCGASLGYLACRIIEAHERALARPTLPSRDDVKGAIREWAAADEGALSLPAIQFINNREDLLADAILALIEGEG